MCMVTAGSCLKGHSKAHLAKRQDIVGAGATDTLSSQSSPQLKPKEAAAGQRALPSAGTSIELIDHSEEAEASQGYFFLAPVWGWSPGMGQF